LARGVIKRMVGDRGFGFIQAEGRTEDLFFHRSSVEGVAFDAMTEGQAVEFDEEPDPRDPRRRRAVHVRPADS
jgi:CspA family cold shock protein